MDDHEISALAVLPRPEPRLLPRRAAVRILLVDDHEMVRIGLKTIMASSPVADDIEWMEATHLEDAIQAYDDARGSVDLVLLDMNLADCKGLQGLGQFLHRHPAARIVLMSGTSDEFIIGQAMAMGAAGYLAKSLPPAATQASLADMMERVRESAGGPLSSAVRRPSASVPSSRLERVADLGPRHLEILELVLSGCTNQEIARATGLSLGTVKNYVSTILLALDVKSRSHLICLFR